MNCSSAFKLLSMALVLALTGCASQPPQPEPQTVLPEQWQGQTAPQAVEADLWWRQFDSPELNRLIAQAMESNLDLLASLQRIEQARTRIVSSRASLFPQLDASYSASRNTAWDENEEGDSSEGDRLGVNLSYELDLWGQLRAATDLAEAALAATRYNHHAVSLTLQAQVASTYFQYLAARDRLCFAEESLENSRQLLELVELQFREGSASRLALVQQQSSVVAQEAQINSLRASLDQVEYALDTLLGQKPGTLQLSNSSLADIALPTIATGQPVDLLHRRPDILQAEANLVAAHANAEIARTAFYPSFRISAGASATDVIIGDPLTQAASIAANLAAPLFDAGRNRAEYRRTLAAQEEALLNYYQSILAAAGEVQSSLVSIDELSRNVDLQARRLALAEESRELAALQYQEGAADFLTLLDAERSLISAQDVFVQAKLERHLEAVTLYRALGGSWAVEE